MGGAVEGWSERYMQVKDSRSEKIIHSGGWHSDGVRANPQITNIDYMPEHTVYSLRLNFLLCEALQMLIHTYIKVAPVPL